MTRDIIVVEDEPLIRMNAVEMLETAGLTVVEFARADEALRYTREHRNEVAAIFTDINLPGPMDGIDLACQVANDHPSIMLLVTSGRYGHRPSRLPDTAHFLAKPWLPLDVIMTLQNAAEV